MSYEAKSVGHSIISVTSAAAKTFLSDGNVVPTYAQSADIYVSEAVRCWTDGTAPTTSQGMRYAAGESFTLESVDEIKNLKVIAESTTATMTVVFYDLPENRR